MRLERLTVQAFRGYPGRVEIVLDGEVVLLYGENGAGKTSLVEGVEWALFGTIARKEQSKTPGEYRGLSWLRSAHADPALPTFAEVALRDRAGNGHTVRRELTGGQVNLLIDGQAVRDIRVLGLRTEDAFRPFLGQCEIQGLIAAEQQERWEQLSAILGFGALGRLRARLQRLRTDTDHDQRVVQVRELATRAVQPLTERGVDPLAVEPDNLLERSRKFVRLDDRSDWNDVAAAARAQLDELHSRDRRPTSLDRLLPDTADLSVALAGLNGLVETVMTELELHARWHDENKLASFAATGLDLQGNQESARCPFCGELTLSDERLAKLRDIAAARPKPPHDTRAELRRQISTFVRAVPVAWDLLRSLRESLQDAPERADVDAALTEQQSYEKLQDTLSGLADGFLAAVDVARQTRSDISPIRSLAEQLSQTASAIHASAALVRSRVESARSSLSERLSSLNEEERKKVSALERARVLAESAPSVLAAWRVRALQLKVQGLTESLEELEKARMAHALQVLSADIAKYYERLSPGQSVTFSGITVRDSRYRQAALEAKSYGKVVNPVTAFSEAEGNCLGLALYFSQRVDRNPGWRVIVLDDPVQSMDQGHEQGLLNLLAQVSRERQVVILTHDRKFSDSVEAQFGKVASYARYDLHRSTGPDPHVELNVGRLEELLRFVESNAGGTLPMREACAGAIRKAVERLAQDVGRRRGLKLKRRVKIEEAVDALNEAGHIDDIDAGTLHRLRRFGTKGAHDDLEVNAAETAIRANVQAMRELKEKYLPEAPQLHLVAAEESA